MPTTHKSLNELHPWRVDILILVVASAVLLWMGLQEPVLTVRKLWTNNTFSVISGIRALSDDGHVELAAMLFFFSVIFPVAKLAVLVVLWMVRISDNVRQTALHWLAVLGKWSMLDVYVVAVIIVAVKIGVYSDAYPHKGIYFFGASVLLSMIVTGLVNHLVITPPKSNNFKK